jgi:hypothetical protein
LGPDGDPQQAAASSPINHRDLTGTAIDVPHTYNDLVTDEPSWPAH